MHQDYLAEAIYWDEHQVQPLRPGPAGPRPSRPARGWSAEHLGLEDKERRHVYWSWRA